MRNPNHGPAQYRGGPLDGRWSAGQAHLQASRWHAMQSQLR